MGFRPSNHQAGLLRWIQLRAGILRIPVQLHPGGQFLRTLATAVQIFLLVQTYLSGRDSRQSLVGRDLCWAGVMRPLLSSSNWFSWGYVHRWTWLDFSIHQRTREGRSERPSQVQIWRQQWPPGARPLLFPDCMCGALPACSTERRAGPHLRPHQVLHHQRSRSYHHLHHRCKPHT